MSANLPDPYASLPDAPATEAAPEVVGVRVYVGPTTAREHPLGRDYDSNMSAELVVLDAAGSPIAIYAAGQWQSAEDITAPQHP